MSRLNFTLEREASGSRARAARYQTLHGPVQTPIFMPVGTQATVKGQTIHTLKATGSNVLTDESFATPWLGGSVGGAWWLGHHEVMADVGYAWAKHSSGSVLGNVAGLKLTVGYQYAL